MRKIVVSTYATLDGFIDNPHEWSLQYSDEQTQNYAYVLSLAADALLLGRAALNLADSTNFDTGMVVLTYSPVAQP